MRGQQSIFADILPILVKEKQAGIGRSKTLDARRNLKIVHRYYYYVKLQPKPLEYSYIIKTVAEEFDLSYHRIIVVIQKNTDELKKIIATKPSKKDLQTLYPYLLWQ